MKAYKGFNKDMTCRGFQFEEGKTYEEPEAKLCEKGFHACVNPIETFTFYNPSESIYREVEIEDDLQADRNSSKACGKKITIKEELSVVDICKAHYEYVDGRTSIKKTSSSFSSLACQERTSLKAMTASSLAATDSSSLEARGYASLAAQGESALKAHDSSSLAAQSFSSLEAKDTSSLAALNYSCLAAKHKSSLAAQDYASLEAADASSLSAQLSSSLKAQNFSSLAAQDYASLVTHNNSSLAAQSDSTLEAGDASSLSAQSDSTLEAGENCVLAAFDSKAKAGMGSIIILANREFTNGNWVISDFCAGVVDGVNLMPNVWYKVENGHFVEC